MTPKAGQTPALRDPAEMCSRVALARTAQRAVPTKAKLPDDWEMERRWQDQDTLRKDF